MGFPLQFIVVQAHRRRGLVLASAAAVALLCLAGVARLRVDSDVLRLLPASGRAVPAFRDFAERFAAADQLYVLFTAPEGRAIDDYATDVDAFVAGLRDIPELSSVDAGMADGRRDWEWLASRELLILEPPRLEVALGRLRPQGIEAALRSSRDLLSLSSPDVEAMVQHDPLNLSAVLREQLNGVAGAAGALPGGNGYVSTDGRRRLVLARPARPPFDTAFSRRLTAQLDTLRHEAALRALAAPDGSVEEAKPPMAIEMAGGHRVAVETERLVRRESILNTVVSLALILPLLYLAFRSVWLVVVGALPAAAALLIVFGAMGLGGATLSAAAAGSAAMLFGLGVDGVVLLYVSHRIAFAAGLRGEAAVAATTGPSASMLLGMFTTAATFYGLYFVDFPSMQQLGLIIGHSMVVCGLLTLVLVPALLPARPTVSRQPAWPALAPWIRRRRTAIRATAGALTLLLGAATPWLRINPSLERLRSTTPAVAVEREITREFTVEGEPLVLLQQGPDLDALLEQNEAMVARLRAALPRAAVQAPSQLLPSVRTQQAAASRIRTEGLDPRVVGASVRRGAADAGFLPGALDPFVSRLPGLLAADEPVTYDQYVSHGFGDLLGRMIASHDGTWTLATHVFARDGGDIAAIEQAAASMPGARLTGIALVNAELAERFGPEFVKGLLIGTAIVVVMIGWTFRSWRLSLLSLIPTALGLTWTAGLLALARVELDLFAIFTVVTFVGIGVDYGIHMVHRHREHGGADSAVSELAPVIVVAGAMTLLGYGTLITSSYPPLESMGLVSVVSVIALASASLLVLPALLVRRSPA